MTRKHEVNIKRSKWINVQLWIIALLSFSYFMYEVHLYSEPNNQIAMVTPTDVDNDTYTIGSVTVVPNDPVIVKKTPKINIQTKTISEAKPKVVENTKIEPMEQPVKSAVNKPVENPSKSVKTTDSGLSSTATETKNVSGKTAIKTAKKIYSKLTVDFLPVFPGCDKYSNNDERAICFEKKVQRLISRKFNNGLGEELGLSGKQNIYLYRGQYLNTYLNR